MDQENVSSQCALSIAFQTMKERCQQLQARLAMVEEENLNLHCRNEQSNITALIEVNKDINEIIQFQQEKIEVLRKQKSLLAHHIFMVSSENCKLWKKLINFMSFPKIANNQIMKISNVKQYPSTDNPTFIFNVKEIQELNKYDQCRFVDNKGKEESSEEISLYSNNSITSKKLELEYQYAEIIKLQTDTEINLKNIDFLHSDDTNKNFLEFLKYHDAKLTLINQVVLKQHDKLNEAVQNSRKKKTNELCYNCKTSTEQLIFPNETEFIKNSKLNKTGIKEFNLPSDFASDNKTETTDNKNICPLCGIVYEKSISFNLFHEHVVSHFTEEILNDKS